MMDFVLESWVSSIIELKRIAWMMGSGNSWQPGEKHKLLFAADSCNIEPRLYEHIHRDVGDVDVLFLGMECDGAPLPHGIFRFCAYAYGRGPFWVRI